MTLARVFFSHDTASQYWVHREVFEAKRTDRVPGAADIPDKILVEDAKRLVIGQNGETHLCVSDASSLRKIEGARLHVRSVPYPSGSFHRVTRDVYVAGPELCFLQAAGTLSLESLVLYGLELCGTYARTTPDFPSRYKREPLTTAARIRSHVERSQGAAGVKKAARAARFLLDGSASVRESQLALMMSLPLSLGGFGLPKPRMNYGVKTSVADPRAPWKPLILHGDIVWPEAKLIVEYDGEQHGLVDNHATDKQRDHLLLDSGYVVVRFTSERIANSREVQRLAETINKRAGLRRRKDTLATSERTIALQRALLKRCDLPWLKGSQS